MRRRGRAVRWAAAAMAAALASGALIASTATAAQTPGTIQTIAGLIASGNAASAGDGAAATSASLDYPEYAIVDHEGNIVESERLGDVVRVVAVSSTNPGYPLKSDCGSGSSACVWHAGDIYTIAGNGTSDDFSDGAVATSDALNGPYGLAFDSSGNLIIGALDDDQVVVLALSAKNPGYDLGSICGAGSSPCTWQTGHLYSLVGIAGEYGQTSDGGLALTTNVDEPVSVTVDHSGNVIFSTDDYGNGYLEVLAVSKADPGYGLGAFCGAGGAACVWQPGHVYIIAGCILDKCDTQFQSGDVTFANELDEPHGVIVDSSGNVLVANSDEFGVEVIAVSATNPGYSLGETCGFQSSSTCAWTRGNIYTVVGEARGGTRIGDGTPVGQAATDYIQEMAFDSLGNLLITDDDYFQLEVVAVHGCAADCPYGLTSMKAGDAYAIAGGDSAAESPDYGDGGAPLDAALWSASGRQYPFGVALDPATDSLIIADGPLGVIRSVTDDPAIAPGTPTNVKADVGVTSATVSWKADPYDVSPVTQYVVTASPGGKKCTTTGHSCVVKGLSIAVAYSFSVVARGTFGTSAPSAATKPQRTI